MKEGLAPPFGYSAGCSAHLGVDQGDEVGNVARRSAPQEERA